MGSPSPPKPSPTGGAVRAPFNPTAHLTLHPRLQEVNSMINKRLKDALFTDQWSELFMDALAPFNFVLVRPPSPSGWAETPGGRARWGGWRSRPEGRARARGGAGKRGSGRAPRQAACPAGEHRADAGRHLAAVRQVLPPALPAGRADRLHAHRPGWLLGERAGAAGAPRGPWVRPQAPRAVTGSSPPSSPDPEARRPPAPPTISSSILDPAPFLSLQVGVPGPCPLP